MTLNKVIITVIIVLSSPKVFSNDIISLYQYCLQNLDNYNTIGYKTHTFYNRVKGINLNSGLLISTDGLFNFAILGKGFVRVEKNKKFYYTRKGEFHYDFESKKIINHDGYILVLRNQINVDATREDVRHDIRINIQLFDIDIQKCQTLDNIYFECEAAPETDRESRIVFGYLENSNVSAFYCLLLMRYIVYENGNTIGNSIFLWETINRLILKLNTNENIGRDENNFLIQQWIPFLGIEMSTK